MIFDAHKNPIDYRILEVNPSFEKQAGLHNVIGKRMRELAPDHEAHWFEIFGKVALSGVPVRFVDVAKSLNRWFDVYAFRIGGQETLAQVLFNLTGNALKFVAPHVTPEVRLRVEEHADFVRVWVEDNGIGIAPGHQDQVFGLFTRLHGLLHEIGNGEEAATRSFSGTREARFAVTANLPSDRWRQDLRIVWQVLRSTGSGEVILSRQC